MHRSLRPRHVPPLLLGAALLVGAPGTAAAGPAPLGGTTLFEGGVDHGQLFGGAPRGWNGASPADPPAVIAAGTDADGASLTSDSPYGLRFDVDGTSYDGYGDRSEVQGDTGEREGQVRAYRWSMYIPASFPQYPEIRSWQVLGQWHSAIDGSPPFAFYVNNWDATAGQNIGLDYNLASTKRCTGTRKITQYGRRVWEMPVPRGRWVEFRMHVKWSAKDGTARHALWVDGVRRAFAGGAYELNLRNLDPGCANYHKQGYYRGHTDGVPVSVRFDNFRMTDDVFPARTQLAAIATSSESPTVGTRLTVRDTSSGARSRTWDLDGDGVFGDGDAAAAQTVDTSRPGVRYVRLRVTDPSGGASEAYRRIVVATPADGTPGRPPAVTVSDDAGGTAPTGAMVSFTARATDPDGVVTGYAWDLDGDGFDDGEQFSAHATYTEPGPRMVRVRVTDDRGARSIATHTVVVR